MWLYKVTIYGKCYRSGLSYAKNAFILLQRIPINLTVVNNYRNDSSHVNVYAGQLTLIYLLQSQFSSI